MAYTIEYSPDTLDHFRALTSRQRATILDAVDNQLTYEPTVETRNVEEAPEPKVLIRAIGIKERNRVRIGRKEIEL